ncbi:MAG: hypothetical protein ABSC38_04260 [Verrucomicrobiia bacterium]
MKRLSLIVSYTMAIAMLTASVSAQVFKPIDPTKNADAINGKDLQFDTAKLKTVTPGTREMKGASVSDKFVELKGDVEFTKLKLQTLDLATVTKPDIPHKNFTAKRVAVTDNVRPDKDLDDVRQAKAPISQRQIHPFMPGGEEELIKQLGKPPLSVRE